MNTNTGAIKREQDLTPEERKSGQWISLKDMSRTKRRLVLARLRAQGKHGVGMSHTDQIDYERRLRHRAKQEERLMRQALKELRNNEAQYEPQPTTDVPVVAQQEEATT